MPKRKRLIQAMAMWDHIFSAGYLSMDDYMCAVDESRIVMSEDDSLPFEIKVDYLLKRNFRNGKVWCQVL